MRSVKVLYSNGLMSKEKYKAVRSNLSNFSTNFLLAGANCSENHIVMQRFAWRLIQEFQSIEKKDLFNKKLHCEIFIKIVSL